MTTTQWRGVTVDSGTAPFLDAVAAEVTRMTKAAGVPDFNVTPIPGCGSYQTTTKASAGTHAGGGAVDIGAGPLTDRQARILESAARKWGGTAWFRPAIPGVWSRHVHILRSDCTDLASPSATYQVKAYRRGLNGLANNGPDTGDRSWVNVTWGAVANLAATVDKIGGTVAPTPTPAPDLNGGLSMADIASITAQLNTLTAAVNGFRSEESGRYVVDANRYKWMAGALTGIAGKVGVDIDEAALAAEVAAALSPTIRKAVLDAGQTEAVADAVVAKLGAALTPSA